MNSKQKIAAWVIFTAVIGLGISYGPLYLFHIAALLFSVVLIFDFASSSFFLRKDLMKKHTRVDFGNIFVVMLVWYTVTLVWCANREMALYYLFYIANGIIIIMAFSYAVKSVADLNKILQIVGVIFLCEMLLALFEGFTGIQWPISPYSEWVVFFRREVGYNINLSPDIINAISHTPTGFRWNPNDLSAAMLVVLPFFMFYRRIFICIAGSIAAVMIIFLTGSRGALIGLALMAVVFVFLYLKRRHVLWVLSGVAVVSIAFVLSLPSIQKHYTVKYTEVSTTTDALGKYLFTDHEQVNDTSSIAIRQNLVSNGIEALQESYGLGVGAGNSKVVQMKNNNTHNVYSMHNFWVEILVEAGVLFFILWCVWYFLLTRRLYLIFRSTDSPGIRYFSKASSLSLIGMTIGMISMSSAIYFFPMYVLFGVCFVTIQLSRPNTILRRDLNTSRDF
ncbi:MAG: hypothetical protein A2W93_01575 [Bacteroidetes bacterium GWF2_43_63]|nr:MAG: hypothetical protein A2W94_10500 [Bacteroidetes bacterium GWE2_42_42]OFY55758.1 MAG: hypothetical protein A2W93_01575 [Bacteroidetes bacterium GWF2_43_63]HBG71327.1 hypothetical protein [Bacteroidales bacterium]HCB60452.1 hypothetical protein [Bacteroidales bacterium]HCY22591.1 hypothetical protein [Bacteroidales bacterium]